MLISGKVIAINKTVEPQQEVVLFSCRYVSVARDASIRLQKRFDPDEVAIIYQEMLLVENLVECHDEHDFFPAALELFDGLVLEPVEEDEEMWL